MKNMLRSIYVAGVVLFAQLAWKHYGATDPSMGRFDRGGASVTFALLWPAMATFVLVDDISRRTR